jgi:hypothetical protein
MSTFEIILILLLMVWAVYMTVYHFYKKPDEKILIHSYFNVREAALCVQCETIFCRRVYKQCPACASESVYIVGTAFKTNDVHPHVKKQGEMIQ